MKCEDVVIQDHLALRRSLDILDGMIKKLEHGERIEIAQATNLLKSLRSFGFENPEQQTRLTATENALSSKKGMEFVRNARALISLLRNPSDQNEIVA